MSLTYSPTIERPWSQVLNETVIGEHLRDLDLAPSAPVLYLEFYKPTSTTYGKWYLAVPHPDRVDYYYGGLGRIGHQRTTKAASGFGHALALAHDQIATKVAKGYADPLG